MPHRHWFPQRHRPTHRRLLRPGWLAVLAGLFLSLTVGAGTPPVKSADPDGELNATLAQWSAVDFCWQNGEREQALALLAELAGQPDEKGHALERAAQCYLELGREAQAIPLLNEAVGIPGHEEAANTLVKLLLKRKDFAGIVALHKRALPIPWDATAQEILRIAFLRETGTLPRIELPSRAFSLNRNLPYTRVAFAGDAATTQYPPYAEDRTIRDTEHNAGLVTNLALPLARRTELLTRLELRREWSARDPQSYHRYEVNLFRAGPGLRYATPENNLEFITLGGVVVPDIRDYSDIPDANSQNDWFLDMRFRRSWGRMTLRTALFRDAYGAPDEVGYHLEGVTIPALGADYKLSRNLKLELQGDARRFTDPAQEDFWAATGLLHWTPDALPQLTLHGGWRHEFRAGDEDISLVGGDWLQLLNGTNQALFSLGAEPNWVTAERELVSQLAFCRRIGERVFTIGLAGRWEYHVDKRYSLTLFFDWR